MWPLEGLAWPMAAQTLRGEPLPYLAVALRTVALPEVAFYTSSRRGIDGPKRGGSKPSATSSPETLKQLRGLFIQSSFYIPCPSADLMKGWV